jgi:hypothetical protein
VHSRELPRLLLALFFGLPISLVVVALILLTPVGGIVLAVILLLALLVWFSFEVYYASLIANWILVSEHNYPRLYELLIEMKDRIGVKEPIDIIVYKQDVFSSFFTALFARRAIFVGSELLAEGVTDDELRWLIGRHVGWFRSKRRLGPLRYVIAFVEQLLIFNLWIYPYIRATVYTGDRVALAAVGGDISAAVSTMNKLIVGRELGYSVDPAGVVRQYRRVKGSLFAFLARLGWPFPHMTARYVDLIGFAEREFPNRAQEFASLNPSFQTMGGAWPLMRSTEKKGDGVSNAVGLGFLAGAIVAPLLVFVVWSAVFRGGLGFIGGLFDGGYCNRDYYGCGGYSKSEESYAYPAESEAPAAAWGAYETGQLSPEIARAAERAREVRAYAEAAAQEAQSAAQSGYNYGTQNAYSGYGYYTTSNGDRGAGQMSDGRLHGAGVYEWADASSSVSRYEGGWQYGARGGYGVTTWRNGAVYKGEYSSDQRAGHGSFQYSDGRLYEGQWSDGQRHGYGVEWTSNGDVSSAGYWSSDVFQGSAAAEPAAPATTH